MSLHPQLPVGTQTSENKNLGMLLLTQGGLNVGRLI